MSGYHVTKQQAEAFVDRNKDINCEVRYYPNRHEKNKPEWGVWNKDSFYWHFVRIDNNGNIY